jgi:DNA excision repair protein ERCC-4
VPSSCGPSLLGPCRVVVDDREWHSPTVASLRRLGSVQLAKRRLPVGDYVVDDLLTVERKTLADFAVSLCDGRLFRQAHRLHRSRRRTCLILVGSARDLRQIGVSREALQGALITLNLVFDLPVLRACDADESARLIVTAAGQLRRRRCATVRRHGKQPTGIQRSQILMLAGARDIGALRAEALLARFGSPAGVARASPEDLRSIEGVGPTVAAALHAVLHTTWTPPGPSEARGPHHPDEPRSGHLPDAEPEAPAVSESPSMGRNER